MTARRSSKRLIDDSRRALLVSGRRRAREQLTPQQIRGKIILAILGADDRAEALSRDALLRTNIPAAAIDQHFKFCMGIAETMRPGLAQRAQSFGAYA